MSTPSEDLLKPGASVETPEELERLLREGLASGDSREMTQGDWEALRRRALARAEIRKSG